MAAGAQDELVADFQGLEAGVIGSVGTLAGEFFLADSDTGGDSSAPSYLEVGSPKGESTESRALRIPGGVARTLELRFPRAHLIDAPLPGLASVSFVARRDGRTRPFALTAVILSDSAELARYPLDGEVVAAEYRDVVLELPAGASKLRLEHTSSPSRGLWIDDVTLHPPQPMELASVAFEPVVRPLVLGELAEVGTLLISTRGNVDPRSVTGIEISLLPGEGSERAPLGLARIEADLEARGLSASAARPARADGGARAQADPLRITEPFVLTTGRNAFRLFAQCDAPAGRFLPASARFRVALSVDGVVVPVAGPEPPPELSPESPSPELWAAAAVLDPETSTVTSIALVSAGPAGAASSARPRPLVALIGVTARSGDAEIVLARSLDAGRTWSSEPFGGTTPPGNLSRPTLVHDDEAGVLHLFARWDPEGTPAFGTGLAVGETPQVVRFESRDGGSTWTDAETITAQVKAESDARVQPAGGRGIRTSGGALVVPFITDRSLPPVSEPSAALVVSTDAGRTWAMTSRAYMSTAESAVCEVRDGVLLLNMTDLRGMRRNERYSGDLGASWRGNRLRRRSALLCAGGHAALLHVGRELGLGSDLSLVFLNAASERSPARAMTLRGSSPTSDPWSSSRTVLLDDGRGVAAPALAMVAPTVVLAMYADSSGVVVAQPVPLERVKTRLGSVSDVLGDR